ncbi:MAG TPA: hypothetical protein VEB64_06570 [Azospirillaceae bacterium]|nr:hypothetical protein [Azospirillaceae bacterium]
MLSPSRALRAAVVLLAAGAALGGCVQKAVEPPPPLTFTQHGTVSLDVAQVMVVPEYQPRMTPPNVEHLSPMPPTDAVGRWASDRFRAAGRSGVLRVIVKDASIKEVQLPRTQGLSGFFTKDQAWRYDGRLEVELVAQQPDRNSFQGYASAIVSRSVTVPEDISIAERERIWLNLTRQMMDDLNARFEDGIRTNLTPIVLY